LGIECLKGGNGVALYGVSSLIDPNYAAWLLKMTLAALNLHVSHQLKHQPDMGKPEVPV
jgi:hypothetical protein